MLCPHCGADTPAPDGRCTACDAAIPPRSPRPVATATLTPTPASAQAETVLQAPTSAPSARKTLLGEGPLEAGAPFGARYRILRALGAGGMGVVYQAWDDELGVAVALKVIRPEVTADPHVAREVERRFKRELLLARQVTHKNVVRIHDLGEVDGIKYITMPYIEGRDLAGAIREAGSLPVPRVVRIAKQLAAGLQAAHEAGVIHRDLKPENVMIDADDQAMIMDFGISRTTRNTGATMTQHGAVVGTLEYMAPEQGRGATIDHRADIYAFGLMLHDMLAGRRRLDAADGPVAEMMSRMQKAPPPLRTLVPSIPEPLERIVSKCVQPDADQRYATTAELVADLERLDKSGNAIVDATPRFGTRTVMAAAAIAAIAIAVVVWMVASRPPPAAPAAREPMSVLIADFDNQAGEAVFEGALEQALAIGLEGAPFVSLYPAPDARAIARQLSPAGGGRINRDLGRLISRREGIKVLVAGSISRDGSGYRMALSAVEAEGGTELAKAEQEVASKAQVLEAMSRLTDRLRVQLGDAEASSTASSETFTAGSLEAMQAYANGQSLSLAGKYPDALEAYKKAVDLDPNFGRAYSGLGVVYGNLKRDQQAKESYERAVKLLDRMTERERYRTLGAYYLQITRNYEKAVESYESLVSRYPADNAGHANLAIAYLQVRNVKKAMEEGRKAIEMQPRSVSQRTNYAMYAMYAGDFKTSVAEAEKVLKENPKFEFALLTLARAKLGAGDVDGARDVYAQLEKLGDAGASMARLGQADMAMYLGRYRAAMPILEAGIKADTAAGSTHDAAVKLVALAEAHLAVGARDAAARAAQQALTLSDHESVLFSGGAALIEAGRRDEGLKAAERLDQQLQKQTTAYAELLRGLALLRQGRIKEALARFREANKGYNSWSSRLLLGQAYLEAGHHVEARDEFQLCLDRRGEAADAFVADAATLRYLPPIHYWLGRAQEAAGSTPAARESYSTFLKLRPEPDPADSMAADARKRIGS